MITQPPGAGRSEAHSATGPTNHTRDPEILALRPTQQALRPNLPNATADPQKIALGYGKAATVDLRLLNTDELATLLSVDPSTIRRWRTARPVQGPPFIRITGRVTKYRVEDVERWLESLRIAPDAA